MINPSEAGVITDLVSTSVTTSHICALRYQQDQRGADRPSSTVMIAGASHARRELQSGSSIQVSNAGDPSAD